VQVSPCSCRALNSVKPALQAGRRGGRLEPKVGEAIDVYVNNRLVASAKS